MSLARGVPDAVLDAATACYLRLGVARTTAADIAKLAGVSRATLYRRFGTHEEIFLAVLQRESEAMARDAAEHLAGIHDPTERVVIGMLFAIGEIEQRPVHAALFSSDDAAWAARTAMRGRALRRIAQDGIQPLVEGAGGALAAEECADLVDWILRLLVSYAAVPGHAGMTHDDIRRQLRTLLVPALDRLLADRADVRRGGVQ